MANTTKKYRVLNPRDIEKGVPILSLGIIKEQVTKMQKVDGEMVPLLDDAGAEVLVEVQRSVVEAYEGDELVPPIPAADARDLVDKGFLEAV